MDNDNVNKQTSPVNDQTPLNYYPNNQGGGFRVQINQADIPNGTLKSRHFTQGVYIRGNVKTIITTYLATTDDYLILGNATTAVFTITLPNAIGIIGRQYLIKKTDAVANTITVGTTLNQTIDGATTYSLASQYKYVNVISNNANWFVIANN